MSVTNFNHHIHGWLEKIHSNIIKFKQQTNVTAEQRVEFITQQYELMFLVHRALKGQVIFVGAKPITPIEEPTAQTSLDN